MATHVAFIRAINVRGHARVEMTGLRQLFERAGCRGVRSYLQTGNVLFESDETRISVLGARLQEALHPLAGGRAELTIRRASDLTRLVAADPFRQVPLRSAVKLYTVFLLRAPRHRPRFPVVDQAERLTAIGMRRRDVFVVSEPRTGGFYGFPNRFVEDACGVPATSRNWNTVRKVQQLATEERPTRRRRPSRRR